MNGLRTFMLPCLLLPLLGSFAPPALAQPELLKAVQSGNIRKAESLLNQGADPDMRLADGSSLLSWAVDSQDNRMTALLLSRGASADPLESDIQGFTPLIVACQRGNADIVMQLLDRDIDVNRSTESGVSPLALCAANSTTDVVAQLLQRGAVVDAANREGQTPLMWAAAHGRTENALLLIQHGADVNRVTQKDWSPLFFALQSRNPGTSEALLDQGADVTQVTDDGTSVVQMAMYQKQFNFAGLMIAQGVDMQAFDRNGNQLLHVAVLENQPALVKQLLAAGADPDTMTGESQVVWRYEVNFTSAPYIVHPKPPLLLAAEQGSAEMMQLLADAGASTDFRSAEGNNVLLAAAQSNPAALNVALELQPDANARNNNGQTALHRLLNIGTDSDTTHADIVAMFHLLKDHGADAGLADNDGQSPADLIARNDFRAKEDFVDIFRP